MLDHHDRGGGHVDADLDDRRGDQQIDGPAGERRHRAVLVGAFHAAVHEADAARKQFGSARDGAPRRRRCPRSPIPRRSGTPRYTLAPRASARVEPRRPPLGAVERHRAGIDRPPARRLLDRAARCRDRRTRSSSACAGSASRHQHVSAFSPFWPQRQRCSTPKRCCSSMTARPRSRNATRPATAHACRRRPASGRRRGSPALISRAGPSRGRSQSDLDAGRRGEPLQHLLSAARQHFGRSQQRRLSAALDGDQHRQQRHQVLPLPTSPCSSRIMRCGAFMSPAISAIAWR